MEQVCKSSDGVCAGRVVTNITYNNMPPTGASNTQRPLLSLSLTKPMFNFPGPSQALQTNMDGQGGGENFCSDLIGTTKEDEYERRSGSDNMDGGSESDDGQDGDNRPRKKRYYRHTPQQIQELEALFEVCQYPDEQQRMELSRRLGLESRQVKFWFQNRQTQMKTQLIRHENLILREENEKLRAENMSFMDAMRNPLCNNCGGPEMLRDESLQKQKLKIENARLKDELNRVCGFGSNFMG